MHRIWSAQVQDYKWLSSQCTEPSLPRVCFNLHACCSKREHTSHTLFLFAYKAIGFFKVFELFKNTCFIYMKTPGKKKEKSPFHLLSSQRELRKQAHSCRTALLLPGAGGDSMSFSRALHLGRFLSSWGHSPVTVWFPNKENCQDR